MLINYELLKNNLPPVVIAKEDRVKYFEFLRNNDSKGLAEWLKELSTREEERMKSLDINSYKIFINIKKVPNQYNIIMLSYKCFLEKNII